MKLSMSVDRLPNDMSVPIERRGLLQARICVSDEHWGRDVTLLADRQDQFSLDKIEAMLRVFTRELRRPEAA